MKKSVLSFAALALVASGSVFAMDKEKIKNTHTLQPPKPPEASLQTGQKPITPKSNPLKILNKKIEPQNKSQTIITHNKKLRKAAICTGTFLATGAVADGSYDLYQYINEQRKLKKTKTEIALNILKNKKWATLKVLGGGAGFTYCITR